jgi:hypothetical protein
MKRCKNITCWTDYPFTELGDEPYKPAPIRRVNVIRYDGDKYATVSFKDHGDHLSVKAGYLYSQPGRCGRVRTMNRRKLERMFPK